MQHLFVTQLFEIFNLDRHFYGMSESVNGPL